MTVQLEKTEHVAKRMPLSSKMNMAAQLIFAKLHLTKGKREDVWTTHSTMMSENETAFQHKSLTHTK